MSLENKIRREAEELEKEVVEQLTRAASVAHKNVGLLELIKEAESAARTLIALRNLLDLSEEDATPALVTARHAKRETALDTELASDFVVGESVPVEGYYEIASQSEITYEGSERLTGDTIFADLRRSTGINVTAGTSIDIAALQYRA